MTTTRTTTAALMLAASTLALTSLPLLAQDATTEEDAAQTDGMATEDMAADATATDEAADETMTAEEGTATEAAPADGTQTEMAADDAMATDDAADTTVAEEGTAPEEAATEATDMAAEDAATDPAADDTMTAEEGTATDPADDTMTADAAMAAGEVATGEAAQPSAEMQAVLDKLAELGAPPIGTVSVEEQRASPTPADAVMALMEEQGMEMPAELAAIATRDIAYPAADGAEQPLRVYTPEGEGPFPLIVYYHGGGWVIADLDTYDASARALAAGAQAVVVSVEYRHAPENPFPAAHDDANAAFNWIVENSGSLNADSERLAVAGESAGGNLAFNVAVHARDNQLTPIDHMLLVYPVANDEMTTPSYEAYADAQPLSRDGMMWFVENVFTDPSQAADPRIDLIERADLQGLPPATVINAEIDPLQSEGEILAQRLTEAGVQVNQMTYPSVAHEFFGMGAVVPTAREAVDLATADLRAAFGTEAAPATADASPAEVTDVEATAAEDTAPATADDAMAEPMAEDGAAVEGTTEPMAEDAATDAGN